MTSEGSKPRAVRRDAVSADGAPAEVLDRDSDKPAAVAVSDHSRPLS